MDETESPISSRPVGRIAVPLSDAAARVAKPGDVLRDATVKGLHLRCFEQSKAFYLYYETKGKVQRRPKLGLLGVLDVAAARRVARNMLEIVASGRDPIEERQSARIEPTLAMVWDDWRKRYGLAKKSADQDAMIWRLHVAPKLGDVRLSQITYSVLSDALNPLSERAPNMGNRARSLASTLFKHAIAPLEWTDKNPVTGIRLNRENKRRRYLTTGEALRLAAVMRDAEADNPASIAFLYLLIFTGARKGEIAAATWDQVVGDCIVLDRHKTDGGGQQRVIHLPAQALAVLAKLPRDTPTITGMKNPRELWDRIRAEAGAPDLRMHDLRHSFASAALGAGLTLPQIGELLGHRSATTTHRYAHLMKDEAAAATALTADAIAARMGV